MFGCALLSYLLVAPSLTASYMLPALIRLRQSFAPAVQVLIATLALTKALVRSSVINNRIYVGVILVSIVAPLSACLNMLFDRKDKIEGWFYDSYFNLFLVLGPYFFCLCIVTAAFLWIPPSSKRIKFSQRDIKFQITRLLSIPSGLIVAKIIWLINCTSNEDFDRLPSLAYLSIGLVIGYVIIRALDYLVWRQEHAMNALIDTLQGLYQIDIDSKEREAMSAPYWKELREFHSKY